MKDMKDAAYWIRHLQLEPHPEGGFYRETYRSELRTDGSNDQFPHMRNYSTAIYFLLQHGDRSLFHKIRSDEMWHFYAGSPLTIYMLESGGLKTFKLGSDHTQGESFQAWIPAHHYFAAIVESGFALCGCTVSPGFDFRDFEIADRRDLLVRFPNQSNIIEQLT